MSQLENCYHSPYSSSLTFRKLAIRQLADAFIFEDPRNDNINDGMNVPAGKLHLFYQRWDECPGWKASSLLPTMG
ncbi:MAG: hypothetical protein AMS27_13400 [Bacteroides sp. SM23_62_1]|nr:MAG: hypothetical protein AMS27_13400 [Bacteroides sp. SM23_62_1]